MLGGLKTKDLLAIQKGDELRPKSKKGNDGAKTIEEIEVSENSFGERFFYMKNVRTGQKGFVLSHYMAEKHSLETNE